MKCRDFLFRKEQWIPLILIALLLFVSMMSYVREKNQNIRETKKFQEAKDLLELGFSREAEQILQDISTKNRGLNHQIAGLRFQIAIKSGNAERAVKIWKNDLSHADKKENIQGLIEAHIVEHKNAEALRILYRLQNALDSDQAQSLENRILSSYQLLPTKLALYSEWTESGSAIATDEAGYHIITAKGGMQSNASYEWIGIGQNGFVAEARDHFFLLDWQGKFVRALERKEEEKIKEKYNPKIPAMFTSEDLITQEPGESEIDLYQENGKIGYQIRGHPLTPPIFTKASRLSRMGVGFVVEGEVCYRIQFEALEKGWPESKGNE